MKIVTVLSLPFVLLGYVAGCVYHGIIAGFRGARHDVQKEFCE